MIIFRIFLLIMLNMVTFTSMAQGLNKLPKYGLIEKNDAMKQADAKFLSFIDEQYKGDRKKAAAEIATKGWDLFKAGNTQEAMMRFNQSWLINKMSGEAIWGMGAIQFNSGKIDEALELFNEADSILTDNIDFDADYGRLLGIIGAMNKNDRLLNDAYARFKKVYDKSPNHTLNIQNWAIILFYTGQYSEAWQKIKLAEKTPRRSELDPNFIKALEAKMPRP